MHRWEIVLVGAVVLLAGCGALGSSGTATPGETVTPAPVTTERPTATPVVTAGERSLPPGVGSDGSVDFERLFAAHARFLEGRSYRLVKRKFQRQGGEDGRPIEGSIVTVVTENDTHYYIDNRQRDRNDWRNETVYRDATAEYVRVNESFSGDAVPDRNYTNVNDQPLLVGPEFYSGFRRQQFVPRNTSNASLSVTTVERSGRSLYRIHVTNPGATRGQQPVTVRNYTLTLYVTADGFVRSLHVAYDGHVGSVRTHFELRVTYSAVGEATVPEPGWVRPLKAAATVGNATGGNTTSGNATDGNTTGSNETGGTTTSGNATGG